MNKQQYFIVKKGKKYLKSWSYATHRQWKNSGYSYNWTNDKKETLLFDVNHSNADHYADKTKGRIISVFRTPPPSEDNEK